jgi:hypothetical protein
MRERNGCFVEPNRCASVAAKALARVVADLNLIAII